MKTTFRTLAATLTVLAVGALVFARKSTKKGAPKVARKANRTGEFYPLDMPTTGRATLVEAPGICDLKLTGLETKPGPALQVWLYEPVAPAPGTAAAVITAGKHLVVGRLKTFSGDFSFAVPKGVRADNYHSVVLWCDEAKEFFAAAPLV